MAGVRRTADAAKADAARALADGRRRASGHPRPTAASAVLAMQRAAGNSAVSALISARFRSPGETAVGEIDSALKELRRDEPAIDTVEKGLKVAQSVGIPVELEGPKPPPSALAVTKTGFGPETVPAKKPTPPPKPVPGKSPLGKAGARAGKKPSGAGGGGGGSKGGAPTGGGAPPTPAAALSGDQLLQPPAPPARVRPEQDAAFERVTSHVKGFAKAKRAHPPAASKAKEAQDAALAPTDDLGGQAKAAKVDTMDAQQPGSFDKKAFITAVKAAIEAKSPKTLKEADNYKESGKAGEVKGEVKGLVTQGKEGETKGIETATEATPDQSKAVPKPVVPMAEEHPGDPAQIPAAGAVPKPAPPEQVNLEAGKHQANQEMAEGEVDEQQLKESNEPEFQQALADKQTAAAHADAAPAAYRKEEADTLEQGRAQSDATTKEGVAGMHGSKAAALAKLVAAKGKTKSKDEQKRAEVTAKVQQIYAAAETEVKNILDGIDPKVEAAFEKGEAAARAVFENYVSAKMAAYKEDRYSGWLGGLRWAKDKLLGMPSKVNEFYEAGRELYLKEMDKVISGVADIVGGDLTKAKQRIAQGRSEISTYVTSLPANLQKVGSEASKEINEKFEELEKDVNSKQESVVDTLASKYVEARKGLDDRIEELQAENKGLVDKAIGAIKAVINTIRELAAMLKNVLARVAGVVGDIIKNPVAFLGNLIEGVKGGILKFKDNILDHLRKGLMGWLFGALAEGGVELPETFDIKGIIKLLASIFGLTWTNIRNRLVMQIGEPAMAAIEKGVDIFQKLVAGGVGALWEMLIEKLGDIKEMILEQVKDFVITKIITAGITWLIGLLNPAAAFIKACKLIYDVIMFFVNNGSRILAFVNTVIDATADIVKGNVSGVVNKIEDVLGKMVPIIIGFLASVIGLGGIGQKIREIVEKLQKPVNMALDFVIKTGLKLAGPLIRGLKNIGSRVKAKVAAGKAYVGGKVEAGKAYVKGKVAGLGASFRSIRDRLLGISFSKEFAARGETHRVYSKRGAPEQLLTASGNPRPAGVAAPSVQTPAAQYREIIVEYVYAARGLTSSSSPADVSRAEQLRARAEALFHSIVAGTASDFSGGPGAGGATDPGTPTPGGKLGALERHGANSPGNESFPHRLHHLRSEHVIPFTLGAQLWNVVRLAIPGRGGHEDKNQTTINIYKGAGLRKDKGEGGVVGLYTAYIASKRLKDRLTALLYGKREGATEDASLDRAAGDWLNDAEDIMRKAKRDFVTMVYGAVVTENEQNGRNRGPVGQPEPVTPTKDSIDAAAEVQVHDVMAILNQDLDQINSGQAPGITPPRRDR